MSYASRRRLHSASASAVLPDPTGPPIPTRRGWFLASEFQFMIEITSYIAFRATWKQDPPCMPLSLDRESLPFRLVQPRRAPPPPARQSLTAHRFDREGSTGHPPLLSWRGSFGEKREGPGSPKYFALLRQRRGRPPTQAQCPVSRASLKDAP